MAWVVSMALKKYLLDSDVFLQNSEDNVLKQIYKVLVAQRSDLEKGRGFQKERGGYKGDSKEGAKVHISAAVRS